MPYAVAEAPAQPHGSPLVEAIGRALLGAVTVEDEAERGAAVATVAEFAQVTSGAQTDPGPVDAPPTLDSNAVEALINHFCDSRRVPADGSATDEEIIAGVVAECGRLHEAFDRAAGLVADVYAANIAARDGR
jgi:hypothetical protein